jgi:hypothetical protein
VEVGRLGLERVREGSQVFGMEADPRSREPPSLRDVLVLPEISEQASFLTSCSRWCESNREVLLGGIICGML